MKSVSERRESRCVYELSPEQRVVSVKFGELLSVCDVKDYVSSLVADPLFEPGFSELVDLTDVRELEISSEHAIHLADLVDPFSLQAKRAFIAHSKVQVHAARLHQILRNDEQNIRIFPSLAEAQAWLKE